MRNDLTVVPDHSGRCGAITWWRLSGTLNYDRLVEEWQMADLPPSELPAPPSDTDALRRALLSLRGPRTLIRALPGTGFAVVDESFDETDAVAEPEYAVRFKTWIDYEALELRFDPPLEDEEVSGIVGKFLVARRELDAGDLSSWLVRRIYKHEAVALRDTGGIYFVPETRAEHWSRFADIVHKISGSRIYEVPALKSERAVEAIVAAVIAEANASVAELTKRLDKGELTERGLRSQARKCEELADKIRSYERLLGVKLGDMHNVVHNVDARIADMLLAEMA
jgi:hypothetical protein